jgi:type IV secretion system protein VirD4
MCHKTGSFALGLNTFISKLFGQRIPSWADTQTLKTVARDTSGVVIGARNGQPLIDSSMKPVAVLGPCRSGKGTSIVVPSLLTWRESAVVIDVHGELYGITKHWRRTGARNQVRRLAFGDPSSPDTFNLLDAIPRGAPGELAEIQALAGTLLDDGQEGDAFWRHHAQSLLTLFIIAKRPTLGTSLHDVRHAVNDDSAFGATVAAARDLIPDNELAHAAKVAATTYMELAENARTAVRATVANGLTIFASPDVARNTMRSSFEMAELRDSKAPMTVYLTFAPHDLGRLRPLIRYFLAQVVRHGTQERPQAAAHRLLLLLDDFAALGQLGFLESALAYLPVYGIKPLLTIQSLTQLDQAYGKESNVWAQCVIRTVLPPNDFETAKSVSREIGSIVAQRAGQDGTEQRRQDITPDDLMRLGKREAIILGAAEKPIRATTLPYYENANFRARARVGQADPLSASAAVTDSHLTLG